MNELWKEICFILNDIPSSCSEELYEQKIVQMLEKLGWSRYKQEIILKQQYQLGSASTIIPDIIVKSLVRNESFVIEVKKPSVDIENISHKHQLLSYMRQLKLQYGLLIGNKIQIYYDGNLNTSKEPVLLKSIDISKSDEYGLLFVELFQKNFFSYIKLEEFADKILKQLTSETHKKRLRNILLSDDYRKIVTQFIAEDLSQNWDQETIKSVLSKLSVSICSKDTNLTTPGPIPPDPQPPQDMKIGQLVRTSMNMIIEYCESYKNEITNLKSHIYSKQTFNIYYPFLKEVSPDAPKQNRYWKDKYLINNKHYVVTSEWFKGSLPLFKAYIVKISQS